MIGIKGVPKGIKTTIYNFVEAIEVEGFVPYKFILIVYTGDWKEKGENPSNDSNDINRKLSHRQYFEEMWLGYSWILVSSKRGKFNN